MDEAALAEQQMMAMMGFTAAFGTSKGKEHDDAGEVKLKSTRVYR